MTKYDLQKISKTLNPFFSKAIWCYMTLLCFNLTHGWPLLTPASSLSQCTTLYSRVLPTKFGCHRPFLILIQKHSHLFWKWNIFLKVFITVFKFKWQNSCKESKSWLQSVISIVKGSCLLSFVLFLIFTLMYH